MNIKIKTMEQCYHFVDARRPYGASGYDMIYNKTENKLIEVDGKIVHFYNVTDDAGRIYNKASFYGRNSIDWRFAMEDIDEYKYTEKEFDLKEGDFVLFQDAGRTLYYFRVKDGELEVIYRGLKDDYETVEYEEVWEDFFE